MPDSRLLVSDASVERATGSGASVSAAWSCSPVTTPAPRPRPGAPWASQRCTANCSFTEAFPDEGEGLALCPRHAPPERKGWPPLAGAYHVLRFRALVAICTLSSDSLAERLGAAAPPGTHERAQRRHERLGRWLHPAGAGGVHRSRSWSHRYSRSERPSGGTAFRRRYMESREGGSARAADSAVGHPEAGLYAVVKVNTIP